ncbi:MAG: carboxymuconolactone decarboxylase family protein [Dermatophilus congolensis]|nr:carboxymuconolactone decarboxylase family protein [Dermatophilus congolensis]
MARIPYFDPETGAQRVRAALAGKRAINVFRMVANSENSGPEVLALGHTLSRGSSLDPLHREVVILRVAHLSGAHYMWHEHTAVATRVGFTPEKIAAIAAYDGAPLDELEPFDLSLLRFTDEVFHTTTAADDVFNAIRAVFDDSHLVELVLLIGFYMMVARVMNTFEIEIQEEPVGTFPPP